MAPSLVANGHAGHRLAGLRFPTDLVFGGGAFDPVLFVAEADTVVNDSLRCAYHGFRFAADGTCVEIPAQSPDMPIPTQIVATSGLTYCIVS